MLSFNKKGPMGECHMTGRKMGRCSNFGAGRNNQIIKENNNIENPTNDIPLKQVLLQGQGKRCGQGHGMRNRMGQRNEMGQNRGGRGMGRNRGGGGRGMGRRFTTENIEQ